MEVNVVSHPMQRYAVWFGGSMLAYTVRPRRTLPPPPLTRMTREGQVCPSHCALGFEAHRPSHPKPKTALEYPVSTVNVICM